MTPNFHFADQKKKSKMIASYEPASPAKINAIDAFCD